MKIKEFEQEIARRIGLHPDEYKQEITDILIAIGKGIVFSADMHADARNLRDDFEEEFEHYTSIKANE